jgi:hypothetical protein
MRCAGSTEKMAAAATPALGELVTSDARPYTAMDANAPNSAGTNTAVSLRVSSDHPSMCAALRSTTVVTCSPG